MTSDDTERAHWLEGFPAAARDDLLAALVMVEIHASAAFHGAKRTQEAVAALDELRSVGDASQAVVSLHLATEAAQRYCEATGDTSPLTRRGLDSAASRAR